MRCALFLVGNLVAGVALGQRILDPTRELLPVLAPLGVAVVRSWVLPRFVQQDAGH
jgi:hypothetical protein